MLATFQLKTSHLNQSNQKKSEDWVLIAGLPTALVLACLYNNIRPDSLAGRIDSLTLINNPMTVKAAEKLLDEKYKISQGALYFDYIKGKPVKIDFNGFEINVKEYNLIYGKQAAQNIVQNIYAAMASKKTIDLDHNLNVIQNEQADKPLPIRSKI